MKIKIQEAKELAIKALTKFGFTQEEAAYCTENCLEGELTGKKTHGFVRIPMLVSSVRKGKIKIAGEDIAIQRETSVSLLIDGKGKTGLYVINKALEMGLEKVKGSGMLIVGVTNTALISGLIGQYARKASENDFIFIGFNNSSGGLIPYGSIKEIFGTNPVTISVPTNDLPVILDMASSKITWGNLLIAKAEGKSIPDNTALDAEGNITTDPEKAMEGGLLPYAEHKGSGMAFIVEILGGALTGSRCGYNVEGGWGSVFILIDPNILRPIDEFKKDVESLINEVKTSPKMSGFKEIYFPGEKSQNERKRNTDAGEFELSDVVYEQINNLLNE